ncbi:MAG: hypothetical protein ACI30S_01465 [Muribaculaceae bacterium]
MEIREIRAEDEGGRDTSRPYDKVVEINEIENSGGRDASRPYDKAVEINEIENRGGG